jgi:cytoskeletal protein CcmA (bactofilin family)
MKKLLFLIGLTGLLFFPMSALALEEDEGQVKIGAGETLNYNLLKFAQTIEVDGAVLGDVVVAGAKVTINGSVSGDVIAAASSLKINGEVAGNVRAAAVQIEISGKVGKNVNLFANNVVIGEQAEIGGDLTCWADNIKISGKVEGDLDGGSKNVTLENSIGGNVSLKIDPAGDLKLTDKTVIGGDLNYQAIKQIEIPKDSQIKGKVNYLTLEKVSNKYLTAGYWFKKVISYFGLLLIAIILISLWPNVLEKINQIITTKPWPTLAWGVIYLLAIPLAIVVLLLSIIGIPLAMIILGIYLLVLYLSKIVLALWLGRKILLTLKSSTWTIAGGLLVVVFLTSLPQIGGIINLIIICLVFGGLGQTFKESFKT